MGAPVEKRRGRSGLVAVAAAVGLVAAAAFPVGAADVPTLEVDPTSGAPGQELRVSGTCATSTQDVLVEVLQGGQVIASDETIVPNPFEPVGPTGFVSYLSVPDGAQPGTVTVRADCLDDTGPPLEVNFTVGGSPTPPEPPAPPAGGGDTGGSGVDDTADTGDAGDAGASAPAAAPVSATPTFTG